MEILTTYIKGLLETVGITGIILIVLVGPLLSILLLSTKTSRICLVFFAWVCFVLAASQTEGGQFVALPGFILVPIVVLRWYFLSLLLIYAWVKFMGAPIFTTSLILLILLGIYSLFTSFYTGNPEKSIPRAIWLALMIIGLPLVGGVIFENAQDFFKILRIWRNIGFILMTIFVIYTIVRPFQSFYGGFRGLLDNANTYGWLAATSLIPCMWDLLENRGSKLPSLCQTIWWSSTALLSESRAGVVLAFIVLAAFSISYMKRLKMWIGGFVVAATLFVSVHYFLGKEGVTNLTRADLSGRMDIWRYAWQYVTAKPLFGYGSGWVPTTLVPEIGLKVHNGYLELLLDLGIIGAVLLIVTYVVPIIRNRQTIIRGRIFWQTKILRIFGWYMGGLMLWAFFESWFNGIGSCILFMFLICMGILDKAHRLLRQEELEYEQTDVPYEVQPDEQYEEDMVHQPSPHY